MSNRKIISKFGDVPIRDPYLWTDFDPDVLFMMITNSDWPEDQKLEWLSQAIVTNQCRAGKKVLDLFQGEISTELADHFCDQSRKATTCDQSQILRISESAKDGLNQIRFNKTSA